MILKSLTLHNFMSYADARLDLSEINVACLCGHNGSGKSALLDAITWALWEQARSSSDELVRLGEKEMWVDLVFEYEARTYRIKRSRQKRASRASKQALSKGGLEFQVLSPLIELSDACATRGGAEMDAACMSAVYVEGEGSSSGAEYQRSLPPIALAASRAKGTIASHPDLKGNDSPVGHKPSVVGHWRSLTAANMRSTQQAICELLRMDYDTFVNSAYLRQGRADEFTTRAPAERKQILSEILGLSYFDRLQESCKLKARDSKTKIEIIETSLLSAPDLECRHEEICALLEVEGNSLREAGKHLTELEESFSSLSAQVQSLKLMEQKREHAVNQLQELRFDCQRLLRQAGDLKRRMDVLLQLIERSQEIESKADEFKKVKEELEEYDRKACQAQSLIESRLKWQSELASMRSRLEVELEHVRTERSQLENKIAALKDDTADSAKIVSGFEEFKSLLKEESLLAAKQDAFTRLSQRMNELQTLVTEAHIKLEAEIAQKELALADLDDVLAAEKLLCQQKQSLEEESRQLDALETEFELVEENGLLLKAELEGLEVKVKEVTGRQKEKQEKIKELQEHKHTSICPLCSAPIVDRLAVVRRYESEIAAFEAEILEISKTRHELEEQRSKLRLSYVQMKKALDGRKDLDKRIGQFNEKEEAIKRAGESREKLAFELESLKQRLELMDFAQVERESLVAIKGEIHKLEFDPSVYANLQAQIRSRRHIESRFNQLKKDEAELEKLESRLPDLLDREAKLQGELACESYGEAIRIELKFVKDQLDEIKYDRDRHQWLRKELESLMPFAEQARDLTRALAERPDVERSISEFERIIQEKQKRIPDLENEAEELARSILKLHYLESDLEEQRARLQKQRDQINFLAREVGMLESKKQQVEIELESMEGKRSQLAKLIEEREDYTFLADCFGKKGIQAVIIENAVPEIESEANRVLSKLTENKMHVALVTQQKNKSGTVSETLDILIGDEIGTRNYELYSGGEAFKINFAVRIALSRLLARRAGARLETLIIDEGFGSQDDASRERLVKAIKSVQSDFQKILVITHISDVREMFPVQIHVSKHSGVSHMQVV